MGKPKLMATIRALHQTICNLKPTTARSSSCLCVQQSQTHSFRFAVDDIYKQFNSIYLDPRSTLKEKEVEEEAGERKGEEDLQEEEEEREALLLRPLQARDSSSFDSSANPCSSSADSSSDSVLDLLLSGLSSKRFFFSPCTTKSILEEARKDHKNEGGGCGDVGGVPEPHNREEELAFCNDSIMMSMNSDDPYWDFRVSMEEMVEAHGLRDWSCLQALLQCYLKLNDKKTHRIIVCAFIDLVIHILDETERVRPHHHQPSSSSSFSSSSLVI